MAKALKKKNLKNKVEKNREFDLKDRLLITATSIVAFGGFMFCIIMIVLMNSIDY